MTRPAPKGTPYLEPRVAQLLEGAAHAARTGARLDRDEVRALARDIVARTNARTFTLDARSHVDGSADHAAHVLNVAFIATALGLELGHPEDACVEIAAAALLHDLGHLLLPPNVGAVPEPLLVDADKAERQRHTLVGARALLATGAPPLWVAAALEHHRGVDGKGYPTLPSNEPPSALVRLVSLASYVDRKRARIDGLADEPEDVLASALGLEGRYFEPGLVAALVRALGIFPPGTPVELSNGDAALVVRANAGEPTRPRVVVLSGANAGKRLDLAAEHTVERRYVSSIVRAIAPPLLVRAKSASRARAVVATPTSEPRLPDVTARAASTPPERAKTSRPKRASVRPASAPPEAKPARVGSESRRASERPRAAERPGPPRRDPRSEDGPPPPRAEALPGRRPSERPRPAATSRVVNAPLGMASVLEKTVNPAHLATLTLEGRENAVLARIDGRATLAVIATALKLTETQLLGIATRLLARGVVRRR